MTGEATQYDEWLVRTVAAAVEEGASSLRAVVRLCQGADPLAVKRALSSSGRIANSTTRLDELDGAPFFDAAVEPSLPPPHPLDYEWRFSQEGAAAILSKAEALGGGDLLLLGATTVAITAARGGWSGRVVALDQSRAVVEAASALGLAVEFIVADVAHLVFPKLQVDLAVIDPPWYLEYARVFFRAAAAECRVGGHVLASLPGEGTRPGMRREREKLLAWCGTLGLELVEIVPQSVQYETPLFERNAFRAAGLRGDVRSWRRGDLWVLRRSADVPMEATSLCALQHRWDELCINRMRVRFRSVPERCGKTELVPLVEGDILPTVSRRDPRRPSARIWTSGNRVFGCEDPGTLLAAARARTQGSDEVAAAALELGRRPTAVELAMIRAGYERLIELSSREWDEQTEITADRARGQGVTA